MKLKIDNQERLLVNLNKKIIMEPAGLTFSGKSTIEDITIVHPELGNPFQYELFQLLMADWKGDKIALVVDSLEMRDYLTQQEDYEYFQGYKQRLRREVHIKGEIHVISIPPSEAKRLKKKWKKFVNHFVFINYDSHLFMTIDQRLFRRTKNLLPYFVLAQAEERNDSNGRWAGDRIGIESIGTPTFDNQDYFEIFRMIGDKSAIRLEKEDFERRYGL